MRTTQVVAFLAAAMLTHAAMSAEQSTPAKGGDNQPAAVVLLVPVEISNPAMKDGCWAQFYDERNFKGEMLTVVGPMQLDTTDKAGGRQLRRSLDSLTLGPKATLTVYEHRLFKDRAVKFAPNSKEAGLIKKLGFRGRIESMKLECSS